jgi:hypothetical protein
VQLVPAGRPQPKADQMPYVQLEAWHVTPLKLTDEDVIVTPLGQLLTSSFIGIPEPSA